MAKTKIDELKIVVSNELGDTASSLTKLAYSLEHLKTAQRGSWNGITKLAESISTLAQSVNSVNLKKARAVGTILLAKVGVAGYRSAAKGIKEVTEAISDQASIIGEGDTTAIPQGGTNDGLVGKVSESVKKINKEIKKPFERIKKLFESLKRIAFYRIIRTMLRLITQSVQAGVSNIYAYASRRGIELAQSMNAIASSTMYLKNSLGAVAGQFINAVAPVIVAVCDGIAELNNQLARMVAYLSGKETYTKVLKTAQKYDETLASIKATLFGFDEINAMSGDNTAATNYLAMFTEDSVYGSVAVEPTIFTKVKEALDSTKEKIADVKKSFEKLFDSIDLEPLKEAFTSAFNSILDIASIACTGISIMIDSIVNEDILNDYSNLIKEMAKTVESITKSVSPIIEKLMKTVIPAVIKAFDEYIKPILEFAEKTLSTTTKLIEKWSPVIEKIVGAVTTIYEKTNKISSSSSTIYQKFKAMSNLIKPIADALVVIADAIDLVVSLLTGDFKGAGEAVKNLAKGFANIFIEYALNPLIDMINNAFSIKLPNWKILGDAAGKSLGLNIPHIPTFSAGGFPEDGLFMANSGELVGGFSNGRTAVANNEQITQGIAEAVYNAITSAGGMGGGDWTIQMVQDGVITGQTIITAAERANRRNGKTVIAVGK